MNIQNSSLLPTDFSENTELLTNLLEEAKATVKDLLQNLATSPDFDKTIQTAFDLTKYRTKSLKIEETQLILNPNP